MQFLKFVAVLCLCVWTCAWISGCRRPDPIRLQPTIEEPPSWASTVQTKDASQSTQLIRGFYEIQDNSWRWAGPKFDVALGLPARAREDGAWLELRLTVPEASIESLKSITLAARVGSLELAPQVFTAPGEYTYRREVPASAFTRNPIEAEFTADKFLRPPNDGRDLAVVVTSVGLEAK